MQWEPYPRVSRFHVTQILEFHIHKFVVLLFKKKPAQDKNKVCISQLHGEICSWPITREIISHFCELKGWLTKGKRLRCAKLKT